MPPPDDRIARLRLIRSENVGPITYFQLLARFGSAQAAIDAIPDLASRGGGRAPRLAAKADVERELETVERLGARYLVLGQGLPRREQRSEPENEAMIPGAAAAKRGLSF